MATQSKSNLILGLCLIAFAALLLLAWIPMDTQTGLIEKVRRQVTIGDALAPSVAALFLLLGGVMLVTIERDAAGQPKIDPRALGFSGKIVAVIVLSLLVMRFAGPVLVWVVNAVNGTELDYRLLRDEIPWKYTGYLLGGTLMIVGMVSLIEGRVRARILVVALFAVLVMIAIYDLPFDYLLLPPNGDV